jgi:hypothetical protein
VKKYSRSLQNRALLLCQVMLLSFLMNSHLICPKVKKFIRILLRISLTDCCVLFIIKKITKILQLILMLKTWKSNIIFYNKHQSQICKKSTKLRSGTVIKYFHMGISTRNKIYLTIWKIDFILFHKLPQRLLKINRQSDKRWENRTFCADLWRFSWISSTHYCWEGLLYRCSTTRKRCLVSWIKSRQ